MVRGTNAKLLQNVLSASMCLEKTEKGASMELWGDTVVSAGIAVGQRVSSVKVLKQYRVIDIPGKYYSK